MRDAGGKQVIGLYSARTGRVVRRFAASGMSFTNNGLAVSPDDTSAYFTLIPRQHRWRSLALMRLDLATGRQVLVGAGEQPAVNDQGSELAYTTGAESIAVRDLVSRRTRRLSLARVVESKIDPLQTRLVWLANGTTLAAVPAAPAIATAAGHARTTRGDGCRPGKDRQPILFIHVPPPPAALSAGCRVISTGAAGSLTAGVTALASSRSRPDAVWIAGSDGRSAAIEQVTTAGRARRVLNLGRGVLPEAIDRPAQHLLYIKEHPLALWEASLDRGRLSDAHQLVASSPFEAAAW